MQDRNTLTPKLGKSRGLSGMSEWAGRARSSKVVNTSALPYHGYVQSRLQWSHLYSQLQSRSAEFLHAGEVQNLANFCCLCAHSLACHAWKTIQSSCMLRWCQACSKSLQHSNYEASRKTLLPYAFSEQPGLSKPLLTVCRRCSYSGYSS